MQKTGVDEYILAHQKSIFLISETCRGIDKIRAEPDALPMWEDVAAVTVLHEIPSAGRDIDESGHPDDVTDSAAGTGGDVGVCSYTCPICLESGRDAAALTILPCGHVFCCLCITRCLVAPSSGPSGATARKCPMCFRVTTWREMRPCRLATIGSCEPSPGECIEFDLIYRHKQGAVATSMDEAMSRRMDEYCTEDTASTASGWGQCRGGTRAGGTWGAFSKISTIEACREGQRSGAGAAETVDAAMRIYEDQAMELQHIADVRLRERCGAGSDDVEARAQVPFILYAADILAIRRDCWRAHVDFLRSPAGSSLLPPEPRLPEPPPTPAELIAHDERRRKEAEDVAAANSLSNIMERLGPYSRAARGWETAGTSAAASDTQGEGGTGQSLPAGDPAADAQSAGAFALIDVDLGDAAAWPSIDGMSSSQHRDDAMGGGDGKPSCNRTVWGGAPSVLPCDEGAAIDGDNAVTGVDDATDHIASAPAPSVATTDGNAIDNVFDIERDGKNASVLHWHRQRFVAPAARSAVSSREHYFFYQSSDGRRLILHPLCMRILQDFFGGFEALPTRIRARVTEVEPCIHVDAEVRRRAKFLGHLPSGARVNLAEVALAGSLPKAATAPFKQELGARRDRRKRQEQKERKVVRREAAVRDRSGSSASSTDGFWSNSAAPGASAPSTLHGDALVEQLARQQLRTESSTGFAEGEPTAGQEWSDTACNSGVPAVSGWAKVARFGFAADVTSPDIAEGSGLSPPAERHNHYPALHGAQRKAGTSKVVYSSHQRRYN